MPDKLEISRDLPGLNVPNALNFEANRLSTFADRALPVSGIKLAKTGFFSTGNQDEVECFSCRRRHSGWQTGQVPRHIHRQISPNCPMVCDNVLAGTAEVSRLPNIPIPFRNPGVQIFTGSLNVFGQIARKLGLQESGDGDGGNDIIIHPPMGVNMRLHPALRGSRGTSMLIPRQPDGTLSFTARVESGLQEVPLYAEFSSALKRRNSFRRFPMARGCLTQELIRHGFFYVGHDDIVLCFFCGLAIHRWGPEDDPKTAHARWSTSCSHLWAVEQPSFIQRTLRELENVGAAN